MAQQEAEDDQAPEEEAGPAPEGVGADPAPEGGEAGPARDAPAPPARDAPARPVRGTRKYTRPHHSCR